MKSIKYFFGAFFLLTIFLIPQITSAEKNDWIDKNFNFKSVKTVAVMNVTTEVDLGSKGNIFKQKLLSSYFDGAKKIKAKVLTENQIGQSNLSEVADLRVECTIKTFENSYYIIPERTVWEEKRRTRTYRDRDGNRQEETYYVTVPVTYPPRRVDVSDLVVSFEVYDTKTGQLVFGREDNRRREDDQAQQGMFGRMCNSFFSDFGKKLR